MAGLFGDLLSPDNAPGLGLALSLLSGHKGDDIGLKVGNYANAVNQQQNQARLNRANDLAQVNGLYQTLMYQDQIQGIQDRRNGVTHQENPALGALRARMSQLAGVPSLSTGGGLMQPQSQSPTQPQTSPQAPQQPAPQVPQPSPGQNFMGANPNYQPLPQAAPQPQPQPQSQSSPTQPSMSDLRDEADTYALLARKPELMAENRYKMSLPTLSRGVSFNPATGLPIAGFVDNVPVKFDAQGNPQVIPSQIPQAIAGRAGMVSAAQSAATSPYKTLPVTMADGRVVPTFLPNLPGYPGAQPQPQPPQPSIPPAVQSAAASGKPFVATQAPGGPVQFQQPPQTTKNDPWATMPTAPQPGGLGQSTYQKALADQRALTAKQTSDELGASSEAANARIATNNQALDVLDKADTGWLAGHVADFRNVLAKFGIPDQDFKAGADQILNKDLVNTALQKGKQLFGSRFTQSEVGIMLSRANPSPEMQKVAIKFLLDTDNTLQGYNIQQANDYGRYLQQNGDPLLFKQWYAKTFPATNALSKVQLGGDLPPNQVRLTSGKVATFPSEQAAMAFKKQAGIQ